MSFAGGYFPYVLLNASSLGSSQGIVHFDRVKENTPNISSEETIAIGIARQAHFNQWRHDGITPYFSHPEAVSLMVSKTAAPCAYLHDVLEDNSNFTVETLRQAGISEMTISAVLAITKIQGEDYQSYIQRVKANPIAREVKIADITHNLSGNPKPESLAKYQAALEILKAD